MFKNSLATYLKQKELVIGGLIALIIVGLFAIVPALVPFLNTINNTTVPTNPLPNTPQPIRLPEVKMPTFSSCSQLQTKLSEFTKSVGSYGGRGDAGTMMKTTTSLPQAGAPITTSESSLPDFSKTNVQVEGVDEADMVKTDGRYIYALTNNKVSIIKASEPMEKVSTISFGAQENAQEMFVDNDTLIVIGNKYYPAIFNESAGTGMMGKMAPGTSSLPYYGGRQITFVRMYALAQKSNPVLQRTLEFDSSYLTSRLIQGHMYVVLNKSAYFYGAPEKIDENEVEKTLPQYTDVVYATNGTADNLRPLVNCNDIAYADPILDAQYLTIISVPTDPYSKKIEKEVVLGTGQTFYASFYNLYTAATKSPYQIMPMMRVGIPLELGTEKTVLHKFNLIGGDITHVAQGEVDGRLLNQFSMDEYNNYLRLATTIGHVSRGGSTTENRVYVLDSTLKSSGTIVNIAPREQIYSARFMGKRGYLVTFKKVDPFFTLDLSDPKNPRVAGQLKIPGFSDYLHPYDDTHIIGVGKDTIEGEGGDFAWYQGLKMAIFDVTDFANPKELHRIIIGDRGSDSPVLNDHKAFLFSAEKNLLVLPASIALINESEKQVGSSQFPAYGKPVFQGALVYNVNLANGFQEKMRITHNQTADQIYSNPEYYYDGGSNISRSLYIGDTLYTISNGEVQAHSLVNGNLMNSVNL